MVGSRWSGGGGTRGRRSTPSLCHQTEYRVRFTDPTAAGETQWVSARDLRRGHAGGEAAIAAFDAGLPEASAPLTRSNGGPVVPLTHPADNGLVPLTKPAGDEEEEAAATAAADGASASLRPPPSPTRSLFPPLALTIDPAAYAGVILGADAPVDWSGFAPLTRPRCAAATVTTPGASGTVADAVADAAADGGVATFNGVPVAMWEGAGGSAAAAAPARSPAHHRSPPLGTPKPRARPRKAAKTMALVKGGGEEVEGGGEEEGG